MIQPERVELLVNATVPLTAPAAMVTDAGTTRPRLVDFKATLVAWDTAFWSATVQVPDPPRAIVRGEQVKEERSGVPADAVRLIVALALLDPYVAVTVAVCVLGIVAALALKVALVAPARTVTEAGRENTLATAPPIVTARPPAGAALLRVTLQAEVALEVREVGVHCRAETRTGAESESVTGLEEPFRAAEMVAD